jgi:integrase
MKFDTGRPNTTKTNQSLFDNWIEPYLTHTGSNLDKCVKLWEAHLQPGSIKAILYVAKEAVSRKSGVHLDIKAHIARLGRASQQKIVETLTKKEIVALTRSCKASDPGLHLALVIASQTGMRRGEVFGLQWGDIDIMKGTITVQRSYDGPTKSGRSRVIPISFALEKVILAHPGFISYNCLQGARKQNIIPVTFDPGPRLKKACREAGVREITFHALRHTFATLALEAGRSPKLVSVQLGHAAVSTTINLYWSVTGEALDLGFLDE